MSTTKPTRAYAVLGVALVALVLVLVLGRGTNGPQTTTTRADRIASEIKCPTCQGLSVKDSKAASARAIYSEIERQVESGESDADIRAFLVSRYGSSELLRPRATGIGSIVWIAPIVFVVLAVAGLIAVFARTRRVGKRATAEDRALVEAALSADASEAAR